ncbi:MAG: metallophosphoesterase family protein [Burkholderiales bacterium]
MLAACAPLSALPPGEVAFGVLGDTPYSEAEVERLDALIDEMNAQPLAFVVHVGDVGPSALACGDAWLLARKKQFARIRHPFVLLPGDNEWSDCRQPLERLQRWRELFCATPREFCEHRRWEAAGWVFVALNVPGHDNNVRHAEHAPRMKTVLAWLEEAAALADKRAGLVILMQANPFFTVPRDGFASLRAKLAELAQRSPGKVVLIHGDTHVYRDDEPLPGLRRIEVWGSPITAWKRFAISELPSRSPR